MSFKKRPFTSLLIFAMLIAVSPLLVVNSAQAGTTVTQVAAKPQPPKKVMLTWAAYSGFVTDHYRVTLSPGFRVRTPTGTSTLFTDLNWGVSYTATVVAVSGGGQESAPATIHLQGSRLSVAVSDHSFARGTRIPVTGKLETPSGAALKNRRVIVQVDPAPRNGAFKTVATVRTSDKGHFKTKLKAKRNSTIRVLYSKGGTAGGWGYDGAKVRVRVVLDKVESRVRSGQRATVAGELKAPVTLVRGKMVRLQSLNRSHKWVTTSRDNVSRTGRFHFEEAVQRRGEHFFRVKTARTINFVSSVSRSVKVTAR